MGHGITWMKTGVMKTGWKQVDGNWYYLNGSGAMENWLENL